MEKLTPETLMTPADEEVQEALDLVEDVFSAYSEEVEPHGKGDKKLTVYLKEKDMLYRFTEKHDPDSSGYFIRAVVRDFNSRQELRMLFSWQDKTNETRLRINQRTMTEADELHARHVLGEITKKEMYRGFVRLQDNDELESTIDQIEDDESRGLHEPTKEKLDQVTEALKLLV